MSSVYTCEPRDFGLLKLKLRHPGVPGFCWVGVATLDDHTVVACFTASRKFLAGVRQQYAPHADNFARPKHWTPITPYRRRDWTRTVYLTRTDDATHAWPRDLVVIVVPPCTDAMWLLGNYLRSRRFTFDWAELPTSSKGGDP